MYIPLWTQIDAPSFHLNDLLASSARVLFEQINIPKLQSLTISLFETVPKLKLQVFVTL